MHYVFYRTSDVFEAEEILQQHNFQTEIVPTPVQDKAYCGVCIFVENVNTDDVNRCLKDLDYKLIP